VGEAVHVVSAFGTWGVGKIFAGHGPPRELCSNLSGFVVFFLCVSGVPHSEGEWCYTVLFTLVFGAVFEAQHPTFS
jgi:hypothetical protein